MSNDIVTDANLSLISSQYERELKVSHANGLLTDSNDGAHRFSVSKLPTYLHDGTPANRWAIKRNDTGIVIGSVSGDYGVIQNADLEEEILQGFKLNGITPTKVKPIVVNYGARTHIEYTFNECRSDVTKKGDVIALRIIANNSFDGKSSSSITCGALRLICLNGMTSFTADVRMNARHTSNVNTTYVAGVIRQALKQWEHNNVMWNKLATAEIAPLHGYYILENLTNAGVITKKVAKLASQVWEQPTYAEDRTRNLWNVYNAVTQVTTHQLSERHYESGNRMSTQVLNAFAEALSDTSRFDHLVRVPETLAVGGNN